jgi:hypothetical protein
LIHITGITGKFELLLFLGAGYSSGRYQLMYFGALYTGLNEVIARAGTELSVISEKTFCESWLIEPIAH